MIRSDKANGGTQYKNCRHHLKHRRRQVVVTDAMAPKTMRLYEV